MSEWLLIAKHTKVQDGKYTGHMKPGQFGVDPWQEPVDGFFISISSVPK